MCKIRTTGSFKGSQTSMRTTERVLQSRGSIGWEGGQDIRCVKLTTMGAEETGIYYQSFSGLPNYSKDFYLSWCCSNFQTISILFRRNLIYILYLYPPLKVKVYKPLKKKEYFFSKLLSFKFARYLKIPSYQNLWRNSRVFQLSKGRMHRPKLSLPLTLSFWPNFSLYS